MSDYRIAKHEPEKMNVLFDFGHSGGYAMKLTPDGRLIPGPGLSEDEATQRMFKALQAMFERGRVDG